MTPSDKAYYSDGYYPLFKLMSDEFGLTLLEQDMSEILNCVRKMDEVQGKTKEEFRHEWLVRASEYSSSTNKISAIYISKMLYAEYDEYKIINELANMLDDTFGKLVKKTEWSPPSPVFIDAGIYTVEQLQQLIDIKKQKA